VETCRLLAALVSPVIPGASRKILAQLQAETIQDLAWGTLPDQHQLGKPSPVFPRLEVPAE
jgi:methionyl-tRNA synthetase